MLIFGLLVAGAIGAPTRYLVDGIVTAHTDGVFPRGTLIVNISGSLVLGVLTGLALYHGLPSTPKIILGTGFCGAYTTFSTFAYETVALAEDGETRAAARVLLGSLVLPAVAAGVGLALAAL
jgi:CrcB protein